MIETLVSSVVLSALVSFLACTLYTSPSTTGAYNPNYGNLLYDFTTIIYKNESIAACFSTGKLACEMNFLKSLKAAYNMEYIEFSASGTRISYGSRSFCKRSMYECMPIKANGTFAVACLYACGA